MVRVGRLAGTDLVKYGRGKTLKSGSRADSRDESRYYTVSVMASAKFSVPAGRKMPCGNLGQTFAHDSR